MERFQAASEIFRCSADGHFHGRDAVGLPAQGDVAE